MYKCPKCNGEMKYTEEVTGSFIMDINKDHTVDWNSQRYVGKNVSKIVCCDCFATYLFSLNEDNQIVLEDD